MTISQPKNADRNLLFGVLALQLKFISRNALIAAMNAWALTKATPLGQILCEHGACRPALKKCSMRLSKNTCGNTTAM